jgi:hypothetical protein
MKLTAKNYFSPKASKKYMSASQLKAFMKCEATALAELNGEYEREDSQALFLGSLVDEMLTGTKRSQIKFIVENRAKIFQVSSKLNKLDDETFVAFVTENLSTIFAAEHKPYADVAKALNAVDVVKKQPLMMKYLSGSKQKIMTGTIAGVEFKIKMDSYKPHEFIADLKYLASLKSPNLFDNVVKYWGYDISMAIYQEIVYQNTGERLPVYLVIVTKDPVPRKTVCEIKQWNLDDALEIVKKHLPRIIAVKNGEVEPERCNECNYCAATEILTEIIDSDMLGISK